MHLTNWQTSQRHLLLEVLHCVFRVIQILATSCINPLVLNQRILHVIVLILIEDNGLLLPLVAPLRFDFLRHFVKAYHVLKRASSAVLVINLILLLPHLLVGCAAIPSIA